MKTLVFVTQNQNKVDDAKRLLPNFQIDHVDFEIPEIQSLSSKEIIEHKLKFAYTKIKSPCFVMDVGLYIDALNGFPGPLVKWFYRQVGANTICQIASMLGNEDCHWTTMLGYFDGTNEHFFEETVNGEIAENPRGTACYDSEHIFIPKRLNKTFSFYRFYSYKFPLLQFQQVQ